MGGVGSSRWRRKGVLATLQADCHLGVGEVHWWSGVGGRRDEAGGGERVAEEAAVDPGITPDGGGEFLFVGEPSGVGAVDEVLLAYSSFAKRGGGRADGTEDAVDSWADLELDGAGSVESVVVAAGHKGMVCSGG